MAIATSNRTALTYIAETVWGTTPGTGTLQEVRYTGESLNPTVTFTESAEIVSHRMTTDAIATQWGGGGDVNFELSYGMFDPWLEAAACGTWTTNVLKSGTVKRSFTIEKQFNDATAAEFMAFTGARIDQFRLALRAGQIASGSFSFLTRKPSVSGTTVRTGVPTAPLADPVMAPVNDIRLLNEGGASWANVVEMNLALSNSLRSLPVINSVNPGDINLGKQRITGNFTAYFESRALFDKFLLGTETSLAVNIGGAASKRYDILIPRVKISRATLVAGGSDQDLVVSAEWMALRDSVEASLIRITRVP